MLPAPFFAAHVADAVCVYLAGVGAAVAAAVGAGVDAVLAARHFRVLALGNQPASPRVFGEGMQQTSTPLRQALRIQALPLLLQRRPYRAPPPSFERLHHVQQRSHGSEARLFPSKLQESWDDELTKLRFTSALAGKLCQTPSAAVNGNK